MTEHPTPYTLLKKYDVPTPRYTSYPTVPCWDNESFSRGAWVNSVKKAFDETNTDKGISLYIHLPFCESLCAYCACTTRITKNHEVEIPYIQGILKEWEMYKRIFGKTPIVRELHLGGGTPTFFSALNLKWLISYLLEDVLIHEEAEFSFEGHPNNTTLEHLQTLKNLGFSRVSFGVQDLDLKVQQTIHRIQPFENLQQATQNARETGFESVSFDLVYGLPFQNPDTISETIDKVLTLNPDRISFYSYAHVPWLRPGQRGYEDADLPTDIQKRSLYEIGREKLKAADYYELGMDHFAQQHDSLYKAHSRGALHRNFMGYTTTNTELLIGLGASAISDARYAYAQNIKKVEDYLTAIKETTAIVKGHVLTEEDLLLKASILEISCTGMLRPELMTKVQDPSMLVTLGEMETEGIIQMNEQGGLRITSAGKPFIRNVCRVFDKRMGKHGSGSVPLYSKAI